MTRGHIGVANISIHALRKESDMQLIPHAEPPDEFQSTLSVRRATTCARTVKMYTIISIHALRKESDQAADHVGHQLHISIHALRKESDACRLAGNGSVLISIHALRKESDWMLMSGNLTVWIFQSTLSVRRATRHRTQSAAHPPISIHALRKESDRVSWLTQVCPQYFNPRSP